MVDWCLIVFVWYRLSNAVYGPICADHWSEEWSDETCQQMNYLEVDYDTIQNTTMDSTEYFVVNDTLTVEDIYSVQEARSNDDQSCFSAVNFNCRSFGKKMCLCRYLLTTRASIAHLIVIICRNKQYIWWCDTLGRPIYLLNIVFFLLFQNAGDGTWAITWPPNWPEMLKIILSQMKSDGHL